MAIRERTGHAEPQARPEPDGRSRAEGRRALPQGPAYLVKRAILGPPIPTHRLIHERLGKFLALPIFSSDALSSVAYATEEMLRVLVPVSAAAAFALVFPISIAIGIVLLALIFSYRQTIKAYPSAGGAYIVTKDNFGLLPAQVAGVALLTDYVLTVAVSISAGVAAIVTVYTGLYPFRVWMAVGFLAILMWGNLRGVKESGRLFASPTYVFIFMIFSLLAVAAFKLATGHLQPAAPPPSATGHGLLYGVSLFVVLRALASGSTAMTGVEAISNGVPAFRPPEWRNARATLLIMGAILGTMFLGISYVAHRLLIVPDPSERKTVLGMIAREVFGPTGLGHAAFFLLQIATMAVLVLAANTSFADFPRLANFHAGDSFMPRQFTRRGHRLVFSNGILALGAAAGLMIVGFQANVTRLIPFYAIGVFTSFSMSQAGMAKRHWKLREPGWRRGIAINGFGALATAVVDVVIIITKFSEGGWVILVLVPILVWLLVRMNHRYERERRELEEHLEPFDRSTIRKPAVVLLVEDLDRKTMHALQYAKTIRPESVSAVHFAGARGTDGLEQRWRELGIDVPLKVVRCDGHLPSALAGFVSSVPEGRDVNVIVPGPARMGIWERLRRGRTGAQLARALLPYGRVRVTTVKDHPGPGHLVTESVGGRTRLRVVPRSSHRAIVLVDKVDRAVIRAVRYALSLGATDVWAVHAAVDPDLQEHVIRRWMELGLPVPLDVIECWDRNVPRSLERYVAEQTGTDCEVTIVMPRRDYAQLRQRILHDRTSRRIAQALGRYEHVDLAVVPFYFDKVHAADRPRPVEAPESTTPLPSGASIPSGNGQAGRIS